MSRKGKKSSLQQRKLVLQIYLKDEKYKNIGELLNMRSNTVGNIVRVVRVAPIKQKGAPKKLTTREQRGILRKVKTKSRLSAPKLVKKKKKKH